MSQTKIEKCVLITNGNLASMIALAEWLRKYGKNVARIYVTPRLPSEKSNIAGVWRLLRRSGWDYTYLKLWINKLAPMTLRRMGLPGSVEEFLLKCNIPIEVARVDSVNDSAVIDEIASLRSQLIVSFSATERFCDDLIEVPDLGAINVHYGALPAYAGLSPYFWHLYNEEDRFGVTLHKIVSKLDAGPIIEQIQQDMTDIKTCLELLLRMAATVSPMLIRFFSGESGFENMHEQDLSKRSYFRHPTRTQVGQFKSRGYKMLDAASKAALVLRVRELVGQS